MIWVEVVESDGVWVTQGGLCEEGVIRRNHDCLVRAQASNVLTFAVMSSTLPETFKVECQRPI